MIITSAQLLAVAPGTPAKILEPLTEALNEFLPKYEIDTELRIQHFLAQVTHESGDFTIRAENMNYSAKRLVEIFGVGKSSARITTSEAIRIAHQPERIANRVYGGRADLGNRGVGSGDGWKYRGRGIIQITGRWCYEHYGKLIGEDLLSNPDLAAELPYSVQIACAYWNDKKCNVSADKDDVVGVTKRVNGGRNGLADRTRRLARIKKVYSLKEDLPPPPPVPDEELLRIQKRLVELRYFPGKLDGIMGPRTATALRGFQRDNSLPVTGQVDSATRDALLVATPAPLRLISEEELRDSGSKTIQLADVVKGTGIVTAVLSALDAFDIEDLAGATTEWRNSVESIVNTVQWVTSNSWVLFIGIGLGLFYTGRKIIRRRVEDAQTGAHIGK